MTEHAAFGHLPITLQPAMAQLELMRTGALSATELFEETWARFERLNPLFNMVVAADRAAGLEAARVADATRPEHRGLLHGLPMTIKDAWEVAGFTATCGVEALAAHRPMADAEAVAALRAAGANIYGKTNVPTGAGDHQSYNSLYGRTNNPWDPTRTPGGSSGGAAAAVATGVSSLEFGSDIGGSIRCPSHFCGVFGHKPSYGIVPMQGHIPPPPGGLHTIELGVAGPIARSAMDLALALEVLAGPAMLEKKAWSLTLPRARHARLKDFRVAVWADDTGFATDAMSLAAIQKFATDLEKAGVSVSRTARPAIDLAASHAIYITMLFSVFSSSMPPEALEQFTAAAKGLRAKDMSYPARIARAIRLSHIEFARLAVARERLYRVWAEFFRDTDVLLCPVMPTSAFPHDTTGDQLGHIAQYHRVTKVDGKDHPYLDGLQWPGVATVANLPSTALPIGRTAEGLPIGVQAIGPYLEDKTSVGFAALVEAELYGYTPPPGI